MGGFYPVRRVYRITFAEVRPFGEFAPVYVASGHQFVDFPVSLVVACQGDIQQVVATAELHACYGFNVVFKTKFYKFQNTRSIIDIGDGQSFISMLNG